MTTTIGHRVSRVEQPNARPCPLLEPFLAIGSTGETFHSTLFRNMQGKQIERTNSTGRTRISSFLLQSLYFSFPERTIFLKKKIKIITGTALKSMDLCARPTRWLQLLDRPQCHLVPGARREWAKFDTTNACYKVHFVQYMVHIWVIISSANRLSRLAG